MLVPITDLLTSIKPQREAGKRWCLLVLAGYFGKMH